MKKTILFLFVPVLTAFLLAACSSTTEPENPAADLEDFGSFTAADEQPAFGDPDVEALMDVETETRDPIALSPSVDSLENQARAAVYCLRMVWGNLEGDSGVTELTDWSGTLKLSRGAIIVTHTIRFEPGQDSLLPRWDNSTFRVPQELSWVSKTAGGIDGIATRLLIPPSVTDDIVTVSYESEQLSITFDVYALEDLDTLISIGPGNAISFEAMRCEPPTSVPRHGHLIGRWGRDDSGQGIFYGRWMTSRGRVIGAVRGNWGIDSTGAQVFVGKYIDREGKFLGFVKGIWRIRGWGAYAAGQFRGRIYNADREAIGVLKGHFKRGYTRRGGYFAGLWCVGRGCFSPHW
jgi:hypothetical protein